MWAEAPFGLGLMIAPMFAVGLALMSAMLWVWRIVVGLFRAILLQSAD